MTVPRTSLADIRRFDQLIAFLRDEMDWPIASADFEDLTFDYTPEELGIDAKNAARIEEIKRMRPLSANQPWGVFFVKFEPKRLPVVALRSILGRVTLKRRASSNDEDRPAWAMEDLLFISNYGEGYARQISFAHFAAPTGTSKLPTLKVLGWDSLDTALHLEFVGHELTRRLAWPDDEEAVDAWRQQWREAFILGHREVITTAQMLAVHLAALARNTRDRISTVLQIEADDGRITRLMDSFRDALLHDLDAEGFADMVAQSIAYGLLSARITDPQRPGTGLAEHMRTNPLLRDLMSSFLSDRQTELDFDELGVAEVVDLLDRANFDAVLVDFGDRNPREDPVIHFYESFLTEYDKRRKIERGVFYTPRPVVSYVVRSVDTLLRKDFGLEDGLADTTTWAEMAERQGITIPKGVSPNQDFVQILDPATGTGTFLVEVIDVIHRTLQAKWLAQGLGTKKLESLWNEYVPQHLLPRLHGYELLMAPYAIAHLKIGLKLYETGYRFGREARARVYLTNALEPAQSVSGLLDFAIPALAHEALAVNEVKAMHRFTVVLGNPPYAGISSNMTEHARSLVDAYKFVDGKPLNEKKTWLQDDYVKFIRSAQVLVEAAGVGVLGYVTNHGYLDNPTFRGMRQSLMSTFTDLRILDLHGNPNKNSRRAPDGYEDKNVFDIKQGVAISVGVRGGKSNDVAHAEKRGAREDKYSLLASNDVASNIYSALTPHSPYYFFTPRSDHYVEEYEQGWKIIDIMPHYSAGFITARDHFVVDLSRRDLLARVADFGDIAKSDQEIRTTYFAGRGSRKYPDGDTRGWKLSEARRRVAGDEEWETHIRKCSYRPFDKRWIYWTDWMVDWPRKDVMTHMLPGDNLGFHVCRQTVTDWNHCLVTNGVTDDCYVSNKTRERGYTLPLYLRGVSGSAISLGRVPNLKPEFLVEFTSRVGLGFMQRDDTGDLTSTFGPKDVFNYLYAILYSLEYRRRYADSLKSDFPRVPMPGSGALFADVSRAGARLIRLHLMEVESTDAKVTFPIIGTNQVDGPSYTPAKGVQSGRVWINADQFFDGVGQEAYTFPVGGYNPAEKWLKDRKRRKLSPADIDHYSKMIAALTETQRRMCEIDDTIDQHGGWPAAFQ